MARTPVGLDIGAAAIKVVELTRDGHRIARLGSARTPLGSLLEGAVVDPEKLGAAIRTALEEAGIRHRRVVTALGSRAAVVREIQVPEMPEEELRSAVRFEAERYLPVAGEDVRVDHQVVGEVQEGVRKQLSVLFAAARSDVVDGFVRALQVADLRAEVLEVTTFALARVFRQEAREGPVLVAGIGADTTEVLIVHEDRLHLSRTLVTGGNTLTRAVAAALDLDPDAAEIVKEEKAVAPVGPKPPEDPTSARVAEAISPVLADMVMEIRRSAEFFLARSGGREIQKVLLAGGTARIPGLAAFFTEELGLPVEVGDVFRYYPPERSIPDAGPAFAVAIGLALRGMEE
ncbi:MAG: type IV pilus assembly protein PilM [Armatimonadota bacterium]|nr:type IV pilus assembly protein PilM [Armatimonadota bacterium]MDR7440198.1 type IV pilus assembly protein PilM [Armatimonadota bacterium]MDR7562595.1 type IV pilus assembly protein PilM [Armatimonadota bacterium]MDR7567838.1 type IV pilus assembly protein PilM [Armatimonadota bacterium]MDR7602487.1 type IV pilus assembly protein PilM [Armatimonadota bacterium]